MRWPGTWRALSTVAVLLLMPAFTASAKAQPQRSCLLVTDPRGDISAFAIMGPTLQGASDARSDVVSADISSGRRDLTVAVRLADIDARDDSTLPSSSNARTYSLQFRTEGTTWGFWATLDLADPPQVLSASAGPGIRTADSNVPFGWGHAWSNTDAVPADAQVIVKKNELRISARLKDLRDMGDLTSTVGPVDVYTYIDGRAGPASIGYQLDEAHGSRSYHLGRPSCLPSR